MSSIAIYEELDQAIHFMFAHPGMDLSSVSPAVSELLEIAHELPQLPRTEFKKRLKLELGWQAAGRPVTPRPSSRLAASPDDRIPPSFFGQRDALYPVRGSNFLASAALHAVLLLMVAFVVVMSNSAIVKPPAASTTTSIELTSYVPPAGISAPRGGGGGGDESKVAASSGDLPKSAAEQIAPATVIVANQKPKLAFEPTVVGPPNLRVPEQSGDPLAKLMTPALSNGIGFGGGVGSGTGGGVGSGSGPGHGPGIGGGFGGGVYSLGNGLSAPRAIYTPEPEYSDEARKAKFQGTVILWAIIGADGHPSSLKVYRSLGMGLDEKAIAAVRNWKFEPGTKDGHPVAVQIEVEVNFHLY